jgi:hypothetical protein
MFLAIFGYEIPAIDWKQVTDVMSATAFLLASLAALLAAMRAKTVWLALQEFRKSKSDLSGLLDAVQELEALIPKLRIARDDLGEDVAELQRAKAHPEAAEAQQADPEVGLEEQRWLTVRAIWRDVRDKLEEIIQSLDGRRRRPFNQMPRRNYSEIIGLLRDNGSLSEPRAQAAKQLNDRFHQVKSRQTPVTPLDAQRFTTWKTEFDTLE